MSLAMRSKPPTAESWATSEPPILPAPIIPTLFKWEVNILKLVEERPFGDPLALLGRYLDVVRRQEKDPVRDGLYLAVQGVSQAGAEVNHPTAKLSIGLLEVQDHRLLALEAVG